jgi:hypothetical protein
VSKREVISSFPKSRHKNEQLQAQALHAKDRGASQVTQLCCAIGSAKRRKKRTIEYHESVREKEVTLLQNIPWQVSTWARRSLTEFRCF